jgi:peptidoglycan/xylan/chitin deacetylase (PgdA/CDA1 family)
MRVLRFLGGSVTLAMFSSLFVFAQGRTVAVTVDDLPYAAGTFHPKDVSAEASAAVIVNGKLLGAFRAHHVPVTGFVIQKRAESLGPAGRLILREWVDQGLDLGNHTYSHPDINDLTPEQIEEEIVRGESGFGPLMRQAGKKPEFFRFPMNHTGDTKAKHDAIAAFLSQRGYRLATCTIDNSDYIFNDAYVRMLAKNDDAAAQRLRRDYLTYTNVEIDYYYTNVEIDYYAALNKQVLGYEPPQVILLHDNRLNADVIDEVLKLFEQKQFAFVSLEAAQSDGAYQTPDAYITKYGPMWGYRWAQERGVKVNGRLEPDPPQWIVDFDK